MICTRELQNRMGLIDPAYDHMYLDDEFTAQAQKLGAVVHLQDMFEHRNPAWGKSENDPVYEQANRAAVYQLDKITFDRRKAAGFPRIPIPGWPAPKEPGMGIVDKAKRAWRGLSDLNPPPVSGVLLRRTLALCLPGEIFHHQWVASMLNLQGAIRECGFTSLCFMGYCASPHVTRMMMSESILNTVRGDAACPYLFWLDDDNVAPPELIKRWISEFDSNPQMDILCGWCWIQRGEAWSTSLAFCGPEGIENRWLTLADVFKGGPNIREVPKLLSGFPCVMMRREVLERLGPQAFIPIPHDGATYGQISEDFSFFYRAMQAGMRVFVDPLGKVGHLKTISQEPTIELPADAPQAVKQWRDSIRGKPVQAPKEFQRVEA